MARGETLKAEDVQVEHSAGSTGSTGSTGWI